MPNLRRLAQADEDLAAHYLLEKGYTLVTRRWATRGGELDIVALDGEILVFVEVRRRKGSEGQPEQSIDHKKATHLARSAETYIATVGEKTRTIRFDLIAIDDAGFRHHIDFFRAT